jgi:hypothetical protein
VSGYYIVEENNLPLPTGSKIDSEKTAAGWVRQHKVWTLIANARKQAKAAITRGAARARVFRFANSRSGIGKLVFELPAPEPAPFTPPTSSRALATSIDVRLIDAQEQCRDDAFGWHKACGNFKADREVSAFKAGHARGWRDAINYLRLHNIDPRKES